MKTKYFYMLKIKIKEAKQMTHWEKISEIYATDK